MKYQKKQTKTEAEDLWNDIYFFLLDNDAIGSVENRLDEDGEKMIVKYKDGMEFHLSIVNAIEN